ncbi:hypothetical protein [Nocardioides jiangxiensis]|uniref:Lipoprotein n=1 Tax=Nocardioides jiangxiensis TaxID=3064524 RepID=A0ABT9B4K6_9ACTN|nr:hypothetical protein [Nocardioides sp. WY-20]MDO7868532.1 hypothetical protein [Nocardioides sp. WY-20]
MPSVVRRQIARSVTVLALVGTAALAGCGGGDEPDAVVSPSPADMTPTVKVELARGIYKENDPGGSATPLVSSSESRCISDALLSAFSVKDLMDLRVLSNTYVYSSAPEAVPAEDAEKWITAFDGCLDLDAYMLGVTRAGVAEIAPKYGRSDADWAKVATCLDKADPKAAHDVMLSQLTARVTENAATRSFIDCVKIAYPDVSF